MNFEKFQGNDTLKTALDAIENHNRMPHAVIIDGGSTRTRNQLAMHLAAWAVCTGDNKPCHKCKNCLNADSKSHSDIYFAKGEGKTNIYNKVEIKHIIADSYIKPNQAQRKVYILEECDRGFPVLSQNIFLKTLEEPPQDVMFIMTCENSNTLLTTILSRATVFTLDSEAKVNEESLELAQEITLSIIDSQEYVLLKSLDKLTTRDKAIEVLTLIILLFRDGLAFSLNVDAVTNSDMAKKLSKRLTKSQYLKLIEITNDALLKASRNVSPKLLTTWLCGEYRRISWQR